TPKSCRRAVGAAPAADTGRGSKKTKGPIIRSALLHNTALRLLGAEVVVARLAAGADITERLADARLVAAGGFAGQGVGGLHELAADLAGLLQVLEELGLQAGLHRRLALHALRAVQRAHAGVGDGGDGVGGGLHLGGVERHAAIDHLGLDLAHVPGQELVARLAVLDLVLDGHVGSGAQADGSQYGTQAADDDCFHGLSLLGYSTTTWSNRAMVACRRAVDKRI